MKKLFKKIRNTLMPPESIVEFLKHIKAAPKKPYERLDDKEWKNVYEGQVAEIKEKIKTDAFISEWTSEMERLTHVGESVIEIGMALGTTSLYLAKRGRICTGLDYSMEMCDIFVQTAGELELSVKAVCTDITKPLPIDDNAFDVVFHAGVIEHFSDDEVRFIINENARIAKGRVICMAPNATSLAYRIGKEYHERNGTWTVGEENPKHSLGAVFANAGLKNIREYSIDLDTALFWLPKGALKSTLTDIYKNLPTTDNCGQGYLLVTIGEKEF